MYRVIGQPINFRNIAQIKFADNKLLEYALHVIKIVDFSIIHHHFKSISSYKKVVELCLK